MELSTSRSIKESVCDWTPPQWGRVKHAKDTGPSRGTGCGIAPDWSDEAWRLSRWTRQQCYNGWTASEEGDLCWHQPMWLPRTSSTGRRWWMHGKSWVRPTPRRAQRPIRFQRGDHQQGDPTRATFGDLPSLEALCNRGTCRRWRKRSYIPLATGTHFIKSGLPVCPVFPFRAVYSSKTSTLRRFMQFMQLMQTEQFMQFMRFVLVYQKTGPDRSRPVLEQTA